MWDEDGQTMEQIYIYSPEDPGIWIAEKLRPFEREMRDRGIGNACFTYTTFVEDIRVVLAQTLVECLLLNDHSFLVQIYGTQIIRHVILR